MEKEAMINAYIRKAEEGMDIYEIRKELQSKNTPEEEIKVIIRLVDNHILREAVTKSNATRSSEFFWVGVILTAFGSLLTFGSISGLVNMGNVIIIAYGPLIGGIIMIAKSKSKPGIRKFNKKH